MYIIYVLSLFYHGSLMLPITVLSLPKGTGLMFGPFEMYNWCAENVLAF